MMKPYKKFDFIESAQDGYRLVWEARVDLLHLAFLPFAIKFLTYLAVVFADLQDNFLRQGLVSLPSYFVEAWFIAAALRLTILKESWPQLLTGDTQADQGLIFSRQVALKISMGIYVLIKLASAAVVGLGLAEYAAGQPMAEQAAAYEGPIDFFFVALILLAMLLWAFRYMWLYIPPALGYSVRDFLRAIKGFAGSFQLMGVWLLCFAPALIVLMIATDVMTFFFAGAELDISNLLYVVVWSLLQAVMELAITLVASVAVGSAVYEVMEGKRL